MLNLKLFDILRDIANYSVCREGVFGATALPKGKTFAEPAIFAQAPQPYVFTYLLYFCFCFFAAQVALLSYFSKEELP